MRKRYLVSLMLVLALIAAACGTAEDATDDEVATTTTTVADTPAEAPSDDMDDMEMTDIVDTAVADGRFTTLVTALEAADLVGTLKGDGPFTVFAPTDDAFAALPDGTVEGLLDDIPALTDVLTYHVVSGKVLAADVVTLDAATTLQGTDASIRVEGDSVFVNDAQVIITDIETANGVIHVIDAVLIPAA